MFMHVLWVDDINNVIKGYLKHSGSFLNVKSLQNQIMLSMLLLWR